MPTLGDFLGALVAEAARARYLADQETLRLAEHYAEHPLLCHLSVPRFLLPDLNLEVPVGITHLSAPDNPSSSATLLRKDLVGVLDQYIPEDSFPQPALNGHIDDVLNRFFRTPPGDVLEIDRLVGELIEVTMRLKRDPDPLPDPELGGLRRAFDRTIRSRLESAPRTVSEEVHVIIETARLKELAPPDQIVRLHIKVNEHAVEWAVNSDEEGTTRTLVPE